jgi:hypothetical protein
MLRKLIIISLPLLVLATILSTTTTNAHATQLLGSVVGGTTLQDQITAAETNTDIDMQ